MGIFDVFKTKVGEAADKAGDVAGQAKTKVSEMMDKKDKKTDGSVADPAATDPAAHDAATEDEAANMVSEGAPVAHEGEAAPGAGDDAAPRDGGMTQSIKDNVAGGVEKAGSMAKGATGGKYNDKIDSGVQKAKDLLR